MRIRSVSKTALRLGAYLLFAMAAFGVRALAQPPTAPSPAGESGATSRIYMPDGQLKSHSLRVYVNREILSGQNPGLQLLHSHAVTKAGTEEAARLEPRVVAPGQEWFETVDGQQVRRSGTLLLFDSNNMEFGYKATLRVMPVVTWTEGNITRIAVGTREVNVANIAIVICWTAVVVGLALVAVIALSWWGAGNPLLLLAGAEGRLSLAQTQIACWTVVIGSVVLGYGLVRLEIPDIPTSLLALMGASLATGGIGFFKDGQKYKEAVSVGAIPVPTTLAFADLLRVYTPGQAPGLSLAKAQMLFWTVLLLVLFVAKSILEGVIWQVPWPLVALMGFSQVGYLAPKLAPQS